MTKKFCSITLLFLALAGISRAQLSPETYQVFDGKGGPATIDDIIKSLDKVDVVFLGEQHNDSVGHSLEFEIFRQAVENYAAKRSLALSMEMFERDVQIVLDEYFKDQITEAHLLASSRPWDNYKTDYRPLVELAKEKKLTFIAANAPRRYVNIVSRKGRAPLNDLSPQAKSWIAPLPYSEPTEPYAAKFKAQMGPTPEAQMGIENILASQSLWDATMADSIAGYLKQHKAPLVVQLNGSFHSESRMGIVDHLMRYRPGTRVLVVTMRYEDDFHHFDPAKYQGIGDFVILTDSKQPRSKR
jgi:uncharacterized iron-regulated protein